MISLWMDEGMEEASQDTKKTEAEKRAPEDHKCACGRKVCCGKHKNGQCACAGKGRQHD